MEWTEAVELLNENFPLVAHSRDYPSIAVALDDGVDDLLRDSHIQPSPANPHYVEDLLRDCVNRISNCLLLRDKAQDVELRAIGEALSYKVQSATIEAQASVSSLLNSIAPRMGQNATRATITDSRVVDFEGDDEIWKQIAATQAKLYTEIREGLAIQRLKASEPSNGSNFVERFAFLKRLFDLNMVEAYRRALICAKALKLIYRSSIDVPKIVPKGYLNELSLWAQRVSDALDEALDTRLFGEVAFAIGGVDDASLKDYELIPRDRFNAALSTGIVPFVLTSGHFEKAQMRDPLLRSLRVQIRAKDDTRVRFWPAQVTLPKSQVTQTTEIFPCIAPSLYQDPSDQESVVRGVHNISPIGNWEIRLPDRSITGEKTGPAEVLNIYLFLRLSYGRM